MRKIILIIGMCMIVGLLGWYACENWLWQYGEDSFDEAFLEEFDAEFIIDRYEALKASGRFRCEEDGEMTFPEKVAIWPNDFDENSQFQGVVEVNAEKWFDPERGKIAITWVRTRIYEEIGGPLFDGIMNYKYLYTFLITAPRGQIWLRLAADTRRECMEMGQQQLLWLMEIAQQGEMLKM